MASLLQVVRNAGANNQPDANGKLNTRRLERDLRSGDPQIRSSRVIDAIALESQVCAFYGNVAGSGCTLSWRNPESAGAAPKTLYLKHLILTAHGC
jgi:hypothetical protein